MPNWVSNEIRVEGPQDQIDRFAERVRSLICDDDPFDFNRIVPMPESLQIVSSSDTSVSVLAALLKTGLDERKALEHAEAIGGLYITGQTLDRVKTLRDEETAEDRANTREVIFDTHTAPRTYTEYVRWGQVYLDNNAKYGALTWYEWSREHWGTKWNACDVTFADNTYLFDTAWNMPTRIAEAMPNLLQEIGATDLVLAWRWAEEQGFYGGIVHINARG